MIDEYLVAFDYRIFSHRLVIGCILKLLTLISHGCNLVAAQTMCTESTTHTKHLLHGSLCNKLNCFKNVNLCVNLQLNWKLTQFSSSTVLTSHALEKISHLLFKKFHFRNEASFKND